MAFRPDVLQYRELFDWIRTERHQPREEDIYENLKNSSFAEVANHGILLLGKETCYLEKKGLASEAHKSVCAAVAMASVSGMTRRSNSITTSARSLSFVSTASRPVLDTLTETICIDTFCSL